MNEVIMPSLFGGKAQWAGIGISAVGLLICAIATNVVRNNDFDGALTLFVFGVISVGIGILAFTSAAFGEYKKIVSPGAYSKGAIGLFIGLDAGFGLIFMAVALSLMKGVSQDAVDMLIAYPNLSIFLLGTVPAFVLAATLISGEDGITEAGSNIPDTLVAAQEIVDSSIGKFEEDEKEEFIVQAEEVEDAEADDEDEKDYQKIRPTFKSFNEELEALGA